VHGRTRACAFRGSAEYDTIAAIKQAVTIPVIANGDIRDPRMAADVLRQTGADGLMIGRAAMGNPWIFREIKAALAGRGAAAPGFEQRRAILLEHLAALHAHYGEVAAARVARKHAACYLAGMGLAAAERAAFNRIETPAGQLDFVLGLAPPPVLERAA
jgi:tRNA-dihydrouridine synthase B